MTLANLQDMFSKMRRAPGHSKTAIVEFQHSFVGAVPGAIVQGIFVSPVPEAKAGTVAGAEVVSQSTPARRRQHVEGHPEDARAAAREPAPQLFVGV